MELSPLTTAEENLMLMLWKLQTFYLKDVMQELPEPKPHQNTISTYLKILTEKKFISNEKEGRIFKYKTLVSRDVYRKYLLEKYLKNYFSSAQELIDVLQTGYPSENEVTLAQKLNEKEQNQDISAFVRELTEPKSKKKKKDKDKKKKKGK